jgi:hypothetical protein
VQTLDLCLLSHPAVLFIILASLQLKQQMSRTEGDVKKKKMMNAEFNKTGDMLELFT